MYNLPSVGHLVVIQSDQLCLLLTKKKKLPPPSMPTARSGIRIRVLGFYLFPHFIFFRPVLKNPEKKAKVYTYA